MTAVCFNSGIFNSENTAVHSSQILHLHLGLLMLIKCIEKKILMGM